MRILYCNKYNFPFSGTEVYLFELMQLMRSQGHEVALFSMADGRGVPTPYDRHFMPHIEFKDQKGFFRQAWLAGHAIYSLNARLRLRAMIEEFQPDVAHVRNVYHHLSPSVFWELRAQHVPVLYHLNDFKLLCPSYNLVSQGEACERCHGGKPWHVVTAKCYPGLSARILLATEAYVHKWLGTYKKCVDCFLAPSQFVRDKFIEHGWDAGKFEVLPHFQKIQSMKQTVAQDAPLLYFGRLSAEKGVDDLLRAMHLLPHLQLIVAGDGPDRTALENLAAELELNNVYFAGHVAQADLLQMIAKSRFTVLPSHAYETLGKSILESYAEGRAVIASDMGSRRELVHDGKTGILYRTGEVKELAAAIGFLGDRPELAEKMGAAGLELVRQRHTPQSHYQTLLSLYERLATNNQTSRDLRDETIRSPVALVSESARETVRVVQTPRIFERRRSVEKNVAPLYQARPHEVPSPAETPLPTIMLRPKLRVAFIGGRGVISKYSGIESYYEEAGKRLAQMGHELTVYCRSYFTPALAEHNGMRLVRLPTLRTKHLETLVHTMLSTIHVLTQRCDVVHYHALGPALFSFIPRLFGKKTVVTVQGLDWQRKKWGRLASAVLRLGERASVALPNGTMVVSRTLHEHYWERFGVSTAYVPNGGVMRERRRADRLSDWELKSRNYILFLGRFSPEKGCHLLIEAYEQLDTQVKLVLAGASSYCDDYSRELRTHASDRIKMLDWVSGEALDELLTNAMLFVLPSDLEGLSLALLDAMGAGLCVLATDVPENREVVKDVGFTFERGNATDLAGMLRFLIANPVVREAAGRAARKRIRERYLWSDVAANVAQVYADVTGQPAVYSKKPSGRAMVAASGNRRKAG